MAGTGKARNWVFQGTGSGPDADKYYVQFDALHQLNFLPRFVHADGSEYLVHDQKNPPPDAIECTDQSSTLRIYKVD